MMLDMFAGTGTTLRVAERLQRNSIGIELNGEYCTIADGRTNGVQVTMAELL
jgi:DNA modification methylase